MTPRIVRKALHRSLEQVRYVSPVRPRQARDVVAAVYDQVERDFGMLAPPVALHSPAAGPLAASWIMLRETLVAAGTVERADKEAVAAAVSLGNRCPYCVAVHTASLHGLSFGAEAAALADDHLAAIGDPRRRELAHWARWAGVEQKGGPPPGPASPAERIPELAGVAATFHYLNRMVSVFLDDTPLPPELPAFARPPMMRLLGRFVRSGVRTFPRPGESLGLLPEAPLPADLAWAAGSPAVAGAFARAAAALDAAGREAVPASVRALVGAELDAWDGRPPGLSRTWVDERVTGLATGDRAAGRLALLVAIAPHQVSAGEVADFAAIQEGEKALIQIASWSSLAAARRVMRRMLGAAARPADEPGRA